MPVRPAAYVWLTMALITALVDGFSAGSLSYGAAPARQAVVVPPEYADLYAILDRQLRSIDRYVAPRRGGQKHNVLFSAELLAANANQGEALLREQAWQAVLLNLDRYQLLGVRAVKVAIKYPVLMPAFPRSGEYLAFYKRLSGELKRRNLRFLAQMTAAFREPAFSSVPVAPYYAGLTHERYAQEKRQMAEVIIREIRPDFLTLENEPQTQAQNTGLRVTPQTFTILIQYMLSGLDRGGVLVGAGTGTWDDLAYTQALSATGVDYIDMHIYPITGNFVVDKAFQIAEITRRAGKRLVIGEAWLYKARERELGGQAVASAPGLFARDVYSFWEPLDVQFLRSMADLSHYIKADFVSFFWARHFFGYVDYSEATRALPPAELFRMANLAAARNMLADPPRFTETGRTFEQIIRSLSE
jgi:hypothetical protein